MTTRPSCVHLSPFDLRLLRVKLVARSLSTEFLRVNALIGLLEACPWLRTVADA